VDEYNTVSALKYYVYDESGNLIAEGLRHNELLELIDASSANISRAVRCGNKVKGLFVTTAKIENLKSISPLIRNSEPIYQ
jgi:DNA-binding protein